MRKIILCVCAVFLAGAALNAADSGYLKGKILKIESDESIAERGGRSLQISLSGVSTGSSISVLSVERALQKAAKDKKIAMVYINTDHFSAGLSSCEEIRKYIIEQLERGCSLYEVTGGYNGNKNVEIQALLTQDEFANLMDFMKVNDYHGFITAGNVSEIYGDWNQKKRKKKKV